jgi:uncharacterized protein (DUF58 family)
MRPARRLLTILLGWLVLALVIESLHLLIGENVSQLLSQLWIVLGAAIAILALVDYTSSKKIDPLLVDRRLPAGFSVGTTNSLELIVKNRCAYRVYFKLTELVDETIDLEGLPLETYLNEGEKLKITVIVKPLKRGNKLFGGVDTLVQSRYRLWAWRQQYLDTQTVKVFPNFTAVSHFELLAHGHMISQIGIHINQRRGEGLDFHQLREFRPGDALRQVDWKATSRALKPISREFQDERDQDIIFLIDNGRRMRVKDGELSHFDHCLNAVLLTSYIALRQGDAVGLQAFGSEDRWMPPVKGKNNLNSVIHTVYDLHSSTATSDYVEAAQDLVSRHRKRSLIVMISNISEFDNDDLLAAYKLLRKTHLVILACLREDSLVSRLEQPVANFNDALAYSSAIDVWNKRDIMLKQLQSAGAIIIDEDPSKLHIALVNEYLALKRSGRI